jgi:hypothetical protein
MAAAAVAAVVTAVSTASTASAETSSFWPLAKTMRRLDGMRIRVGEHVVRLERDTLLCSGVGRAIRRDGVRRWNRFDCTYSAFIGARSYDCEFQAVVVGQRLSLRRPRWIEGAP